MKSSYRGVILLALILFASIVCTQYTVNMYFAQRYMEVLLLSGAAVVLFPLAWMVFRKDQRDRREQVK
ncbi:hypothetical protein [Brevibacillus brevis]|uniref:hypothetical protein n=1 Tax=Brevibacillus brevis TaxID=1393 RepID=UPI000D1034DE|nr:hypothetical protein [Brevibacillus brevis]PSJ69529.1 hypothetical protein C7J99_08955 [Brevibacillus brevis]RED23056.1 hypothetical protein DES34_11529 [Brevibacillus brevis]GEC89684.1 hypothetical protein BBR01nite_20150 [Brevibacillus brevis]VEF87438.1 Uncharacterised protein [Brevibacillus brevis]